MIDEKWNWKPLHFFITISTTTFADVERLLKYCKTSKFCAQEHIWPDVKFYVEQSEIITYCAAHIIPGVQEKLSSTTLSPKYIGLG